jgi:monovalent cation:H+ antiporter-2, CPA2 family
VIRSVQDQRDARYSLLRGYFHGMGDDTVDEMDHERLTTFTLPLAAKTLGQPLGDLALHAVGVRVVSLRRAAGTQVTVDDDCVLHDGDTLVLSGKPEALAVGQEKLLRG